MSQQAAVEFVCYQEGGVIDVQQALDHLLEPTLDQLLQARRDVDCIEELTPPETVFKPALRPLELYRAADDLLAHVLFRDRIECKPYQPQARSYLLASPTVERVYPFRKPVTQLAIESKGPTPSATIEPTQSPPRYSELERATSEAAPSTGERVFPFKKELEPDARSVEVLTPDVETSGATIDVTPSRVALPAPSPRVIDPPPPVARPHSQNFDMLVGNRRVVEQLSFHDLLAARSRIRDEIQPRSISPRTVQWPKLLTRIAADLTLFGGCGAVGAGVLALIRRESFDGGAGALILGGVAVVGTVVLIRILARSKDKTQLVHARA